MAFLALQCPKFEKKERKKKKKEIVEEENFQLHVPSS